MTRRVLVFVKGTQLSETERIETPELITTGIYSCDGLVHQVQYEETLSDSGACTRNVFTFTENKAELKKEGEVQAYLAFEPGKSNLTVYRTEYGDIAVEMQTKAVDVQIEETSISIRLEYTMDMNGAPTAQYLLSVTLTANE